MGDRTAEKARERAPLSSYRPEKTAGGLKREEGGERVSTKVSSPLCWAALRGQCSVGGVHIGTRWPLEGGVGTSDGCCCGMYVVLVCGSAEWKCARKTVCVCEGVRSQHIRAYTHA